MSTSLEERNHEIGSARNEIDRISNELEMRNREVADLEQGLRRLEAQLADSRGLLEGERADAREAREAVSAMKRSLSWRLTRPLRLFGDGSDKK